MPEKIITYVGGLIALAIVVRNGDSISGIIQAITTSGSMFANVLLGGSNR